MRFDRLSHGDTLTDSTKRLDRLYDPAEARRLQAASCSPANPSAPSSSLMAGGFVPTMSTRSSPPPPAAYGSFDDFYDSWRLNAIQASIRCSSSVKRARVMMFYFHGDDFDPGGRGERSRAILSERGLGYAVVDQPAYLSGHWASSTGLFLRRYGNCIRDFANDDKLTRASWLARAALGLTPAPSCRPPMAYSDPSWARNATPATPTGSASPATRRLAKVAPGRFPRRLVRLLPERPRGPRSRSRTACRAAA